MRPLFSFRADGIELGSILDVEASHLALSKAENVSDRLVFKPECLPLERFAFEIADGLPDFCDDRAIRSSMKAHRLDVRTDHGPLARPVLAYGLAAMDVATIHTVAQATSSVSTVSTPSMSRALKRS
jgi:hypothetical protein